MTRYFRSRTTQKIFSEEDAFKYVGKVFGEEFVKMMLEDTYVCELVENPTINEFLNSGYFVEAVRQYVEENGCGYSEAYRIMEARANGQL